MYTLKNFRTVALIEATSFLILLVFTVIKSSGGSATGVHVMGPIHGVLFLAYVLLVMNIRDDERWDGRTTGLILLGAVLPFGGYVVDRALARGWPQTA